jgi:hypothetical protein
MENTMHTPSLPLSISVAVSISTTSRLALQAASVCAMLALLTACGGGGGGDAPPATKAWRGAALIEASDEGASRAQLAFTADGSALAVWRQDDGTRHNIWANRYSPGTGWAMAELIETGVGEAGVPQIGMDATGHGIAVWHQDAGARTNIVASHYTPGAGWGTAVVIEAGAGVATYPQVRVNASGQAVVVWLQSNGTRDSIWANHYTPGTGWGTAVLLETDDAGDAADPGVGLDSAGNALAVWRQSNGVRFNNWANRYTPGTGWGVAELIETEDLGQAYSPDLAMDPSGNAMAVWFQNDGTRHNIWANRYSVATGWGVAELIEDDNTGGAEDPQVAVDVLGNALAVWRQFDGTHTNIVANRYRAGTGWGTAVLIESNSEGDAAYPQIALDGSGNALAVWEQEDATPRNNIWANRYRAGTGWSTAELIETDDAGNAYSPQIAFDASGNALAVWQQDDDTRYSIWANRYE